MEDDIISSNSLDELTARFGEKPPQSAPIKNQECKMDQFSFFEPCAYRESSKSVYKSQMFYNKSLAALRQRGYARHARGPEHFHFRLRARKNLFSTKDMEIVGDMGWPAGEWLSHAIECDWDKHVLALYDDPEGLFWDTAANKYITSPYFTCSAKRTFNIPQGDNEINPLRKFSKEFIAAVYGRVDNLQSFLKGSNGNAPCVTLTRDEGIWPLVTAADETREDYSVCIGYGVAASRGIK